MTSLQLGALIHNSQLAALLRELEQQILTDIGMSHLTAAEADCDLAAVALLRASFSRLVCSNRYLP